MKMIKKIITLAIILMLCMTINAYAGTTEIKLTPSTTEVKVGDKITVVLSGKRGNGIEGIDGTLQYDTTKLKLVSTTILAKEEGGEDDKYSNLSGKNEATGEYQLSMILKSNPAPTEGDLIQIKFEVLEGAKENDTLSIKLVNTKLADGEGNTEDIGEVTAADIKVKSSTTGNNNQTGGNNNPSDYPYAGVNGYAVISIFAVMVIGIIMHIKVRKYRDIQ